MTDKVRSVYELLERLYGVEVSNEENPLVTQVGVTDVIIAPNNPRRLSLVIINLSANSLYVRPVSPAASTAGILLTASGGSLTLNYQSDQHLPSLEWHAIASGAASAILVLGVLIK